MRQQRLRTRQGVEWVQATTCLPQFGITTHRRTASSEGRKAPKSHRGQRPRGAVRATFAQGPPRSLIIARSGTSPSVAPPSNPSAPITAPHTFLAADVHEALPKLSAWSSMPATPLTGLMSPGQLGGMSSLPTSPQPNFPAPAGGRQRASLQASALASARASACASRLSSRPSARASAATTPNIGAGRANFGAAFEGVGHNNLADSSPLEHAALMQWLDSPPRVPPPSREHGYCLSHRLASPASMPRLTVRVGGGWGVDVKPVLLGSSVLPAARLRPVHSPKLLSTVPNTCFGSVPTSLDALGGMGLTDHEVAELNMQNSMQNTPFKSRP